MYFLELVELFNLILSFSNLTDAKHNADGRTRDHISLADCQRVIQDDGFIDRKRLL